ncbi:MAG TPA: DoxX family protein [Chitinophagales bacterium]|jgi:hypothetical protein|nr:DoxX family protein [Chitinophagales bacterium]HQD12016.1 DoxX family protein [Chitinophagales bacterium]HQO32792.1 DoxX family protein [Chitinophagales bacterium]
MKTSTKFIDIGTRLIVAGIFGYTAFLKFTAAPAFVYIFQRLGMESAGRYGFAVMETITLVLLLIPRTAWRGAMLGGLMTFGAICMHLTIVEINILGDGGLLFASAIVALVACFSIMVMHRTELEAELN